MAEIRKVWLNGRLRPAAKAAVSVFDHGLTVGDGVFETLKATRGVPFAPQRHLDRLRRSAAGLGLLVPYGDDELRTAMAQVLAAHDLALARVRITVTGGGAPLGSDRGDEPATVVIAVGPLEPPAESAAVCVVPWPRNERGALAGIKSTSYAENVVALGYAKERGCTEAIFATTDGHLCEGTGSNVFCVFGSQIITPPLSSGCLAGVTRDLVLEVTDAVEEDIALRSFRTADEVFLTSTGRDVQPVRAIDDIVVRAPGRVTRGVAEAFAALAATTSDP